MVDVFGYIILFILGLIFGSFFNVVGIRTAEKQSIATPRSHCPKCKNTLSPSELIPVISYFIQKGQCKHCGTKISLKYPVFELITAILFATAPLFVGFTSELIIILLLISLAVIVTISDLHKMIIPNTVLKFFFYTMIVVRIILPTDPWWDAPLGLATGFILLYLIAMISRGGMGGGDIKLFAVLGLFVGLKGIVLTLVLAAMIGALGGLVQMMLGQLSKREPMPFAPYIAIAVIISYYTGDYLWSLYLLMF